ncbi:MAG: hypothetical protein GF355_00040 [Candidatus Eisenbacteria bacterium]|nr:hypothetical protein [Candidatus Eisenbacteria bacterium]
MGPCNGGAAPPDLQNIWPDADSTAWTYSLTERVWPDSSGPVLHESEGEVEPAPTMDEIEDMLGAGPTADSVRVTEGMYRQMFDGYVTTMSGVRAQLIRETTFCEHSRYPDGKQREDAGGFICKLLKVRPGLRTKAMALGFTGSQAEGIPQVPWQTSVAAKDVGPPTQAAREDCDFEFGQIYLHGYAWTKTGEYIGGYGDLDQDLSWKFLERDLSVGHEFTHQLVPSLADDVFLHARIISRRPVTTELADFERCVECLYMIDYGVTTATDENGQELGYYRYYDYGTIIYAPGVGPVYSYEKHPPLAPAELAPNPSGLNAGEYELSLVGTNACW